MKAANLQLELERLNDLVLPGRQAAVQNEALRRVAVYLRRMDTRVQRRLPCRLPSLRALSRVRPE
jgi:hypothetical protein